MSIDYRELPAQKTVELTMSGKVSESEFDELVAPLEAFMRAHQPVKVLEIISDLEGFDMATWKKGTRFDLQHMKYVSHCAIVSDSGWIGPLAKLAGSLVNTKLRTFDAADINAARAWLQEA